MIERVLILTSQDGAQIRDERGNIWTKRSTKNWNTEWNEGKKSRWWCGRKIRRDVLFEGRKKERVPEWTEKRPQVVKCGEERRTARIVDVPFDHFFLPLFALSFFLSLCHYPQPVSLGWASF